MNKPRILFLVTEDWYFWSHRLPIAREARRCGYDVIVATKVNHHGEEICKEGFKLVALKLQRRSINPLHEINAIREIIKVYRCEAPDLVHNVAMKPVLYGSLAAQMTRVPYVVNTLAGLGYVFTSGQIKARLLRPMICFALRLLLNRRGIRLILQNGDDCAAFIRSRLVGEGSIRLIKGSGVDTEMFRPTPERTGMPIVMLASRMLWDKGIGEFVEAAKILKNRGIAARFVLVGDCDMHNPNSVSVSALQEWTKSGIVEWWGKRNDMTEVLAQASIACLPSAYGEGVPKVLLEAAACGLPIVTTDTPGCREIVRQGENGLLVPVRSVSELAEALQSLVENPALRRRMGERGREIVVKEFAVEKVVAETMAVYEELLNK